MFLRCLIDAPRWLLLALLVEAPWLYGSTPPWTIELLKVLMAVVVALWLISCLARRSWPRIPLLCLIPVLLLLAQGWWMTFNAQGVYTPADSMLTSLVPPWPGAPGSIERSLSVSTMQRISGLLGILCFACDLSLRPVWRHRLWLTMALTGVSIVLLGLIQAIDHAPMIFWAPARPGSTFFATYFYHANAGAYINLILPLLAAFASFSFGLQKSRGKAWWLPLSLIVLAGAFTNTSRGAQTVTLALAVVFGTRQLLLISRSTLMGWRTKLSLIALIVIVLVPIGLLGWESTAKRWESLGDDLPKDGRRFAARVTMQMAKDAGMFGFGPGTFQIGFPFYITDENASIRAGRWRYAHNDYLQTIAEWGWGGAAAWGTLFAAGLLTATLQALRRLPRRSPNLEQTLLLGSAVSLLGVALHALVDFPLQIASLQLYTAILLGIGATSVTRMRSIEREDSEE